MGSNLQVDEPSHDTANIPATAARAYVDVMPVDAAAAHQRISRDAVISERVNWCLLTSACLLPLHFCREELPGWCFSQIYSWDPHTSNVGCCSMKKHPLQYRHCKFPGTLHELALPVRQGKVLRPGVTNHGWSSQGVQCVGHCCGGAKTEHTPEEILAMLLTHEQQISSEVQAEAQSVPIYGAGFGGRVCPEARSHQD